MDRNEKERMFLDLLPVIRSAAFAHARRFRLHPADAVQDACLVVWEALDSYDPARAQPTTFINSCVQRGGGKRHVLLSEEVIKDGHGRPTTLGSILPDRRRNSMDELLQREDFDERIKACTPRGRELLKRIFVDGQEQKDLAPEMGMSPAGVSYHVVRCLAEVTEREHLPKEKRRELRRPAMKGRR